LGFARRAEKKDGFLDPLGMTAHTLVSAKCKEIFPGENRVMLQLSSNLDKQIREHGAKDYPHECCGAMLGTDGGAGREVRVLFPLINRRDDSPRNRFSITPEDFRAAERAAAERGLDLLGWYHSHPDHPARPSEFDREHAWPWYS
jgi:proteasome lid subunit RPN8/RPN11